MSSEERPYRRGDIRRKSPQNRGKHYRVAETYTVESESTAVELSDLLNDDGSFNSDAAERFGQQNQPSMVRLVSSEQCAYYRAVLLAYDDASTTTFYPRKVETVLQHVRGECSHADLRTPPLEYSVDDQHWVPKR